MPAIEKTTLVSRHDSLGISTIVMRPDTGSPKAVIQFIHGVCGCKERFIPAMEHFRLQGFTCIAHDHRGHGESISDPEDLGYMYNGGSDAVTDDILMVNEWARAYFPSLPVIMIGHSMGALAAKVFMSRYGSSLSGIVLCGLPSYNRLSPVSNFITDALCRYGAGRMRIGLLQGIMSDIYNWRFRHEGKQAWTCADPEVRAEFEANSSCNFKMTASCASCVTGLMLQAYSSKGSNHIDLHRHIATGQNTDNFPGQDIMNHGACNTGADHDLPIMLLYGEDDPCMGSPQKPRKTAALMEKEGYGNVTIKTYPSMRHELLNGRGCEPVLDDISGFISSFTGH